VTIVTIVGIPNYNESSVETTYTWLQRLTYGTPSLFVMFTIGADSNHASAAKVENPLGSSSQVGLKYASTMKPYANFFGYHC
jgi:hypothetical protein